MACHYCDNLRPITPSQWNQDRAGSDPAIIIEHTFNIDTGKNGVMCGFFTDQFEDLEPDAVFRFNYCPMCGEELGDPKLDQFEKRCADVIERTPNTLDMLGDQ